MKLNTPIKREDLEGFTGITRLFGDHSPGDGINQSIDMMTKPGNKAVWFVLTDHKVSVYKGPSLDEAIEIYNRILNTFS